MMLGARRNRCFVPKITARIGETITVVYCKKKYNAKVSVVVTKTGLLEAKCGKLKFLCNGEKSVHGEYYGQIIK